MAFFIVWLLIIILIILREHKRQQRRNMTGGPMQQYGQRGQQYQNRGPSNQNMVQMQNAMTRKQQELKQRLQQQYGSRQSGNQQQGSMQQGGSQRNAAQQRMVAGQPRDILSRANANVRENDAQRLEQTLISNDMNAGSMLGMQELMKSDLMQEVNDLIVKGYQADLTFERDFLSEGIELLNAYELQAEV